MFKNEKMSNFHFLSLKFFLHELFFLRFQTIRQRVYRSMSMNEIFKIVMENSAEGGQPIRMMLPLPHNHEDESGCGNENDVESCGNENGVENDSWDESESESDNTASPITGELFWELQRAMRLSLQFPKKFSSDGTKRRRGILKKYSTTLTNSTKALVGTKSVSFVDYVDE